MENSTAKNFYTFQDIEDYGHRLHFNTALNAIINAFTAFIILKYSTKAMRFYKYYVLMTVIGAFILDFHTTTIFGIFTLFPTPIICAAGLARTWGWFWGMWVNWVSSSLFSSSPGTTSFRVARSMTVPPNIRDFKGFWLSRFRRIFGFSKILKHSKIEIWKNRTFSEKIICQKNYKNFDGLFFEPEPWNTEAVVGWAGLYFTWDQHSLLRNEYFLTKKKRVLW